MSFPQTFSLVMPAFNEERFIGAQLQSILSQSRQPDEIIVVDDHSTDSTAGLLDEYQRAFAHVKVFHLPANVGVTRALLFGLNQAMGAYVSPISANDLVPPGVFEVGMALLGQHPGAAFFVGDPASLGPDGQVHWRRMGYADQPCFITPRQVLRLPFATNPLHSAGLWVRRDLFLGLPGWQDIGHAADRWCLHVLALRHGFCYAPILAYVMRQHDRPAMARQRRLISDARVLDLLDSPAYADVRAALIASGVFAADGWGETFIQLMMDRYDALRGHKDPPIEATIGRQMLGAKHAVLVRAEELLQNPELGRRYAATLGPGANVTLVVYAPGWNGTALASQMREVVPELTSEPGPDVLLLALPHPDDDAVSARCSALVTNDPVPAGLSRLERFTASDLVALRDRLQ